MAEQRGKGRGGGGRKRRSKDKEFMDAALDAYIRGQALLLWRDYKVYRERQEQSPARAVQSVGFFGDRGAYEPVWNRHWEQLVLPAASGTDGELYAQMEDAVRAAVLEERDARISAGDAAFEDTEDYNAFVRQALNQLLKESSAESDV